MTGLASKMLVLSWLFIFILPCFISAVTVKFWSLRKAMCFVLYLFHEDREFSLGRDNCKISISGKLIFMGENFMLLLLLFRAKNIDN